MEQEWSGRLTALEERVSGGLRRIGALEQGQETLRRLATAVEVLEHFDLAGYFNRICGADLEKKRNSKDAVIAYLLNMTGSDAEMVMVGDTEYDVLGAAAHGIPTIGVSWGYGDVAAMEKAGAKAIVNSTEELLEMLR